MKAFILLALLALSGAEYVYRGSPAFINDNNVLQYALTLENLEDAFYEGALEAFSGDIAGVPRELIEIIADHERAHVAAISQLLRDRGVVPVTRCNYTFDFGDEDAFIATAAALERAGVSAYDGAIKFLTQTDLLTLAAGVAAVEARHASFLGAVFDNRPFPNVTDIALDPSSILSVAGPFFVSGCAQLAPIVNPSNLLKNASSFRNPAGLNQTVFNQSLAYANDNSVLQYALTLEHLESQFYTNALNQISASVFAGVAGLGFREMVQLIAAQEAAHVLYLQSFLNARGATPVAPCAYKGITFSDSAESFGTFLQTGIALENVGTSAYIGAHTLLTDEGLISSAATITTVEARHTAYLRLVASDIINNATAFIPFPNTVDAPLTPTEVLLQAGAFLVSPAACITFTPPVPADTFRPNVTMTSSSTTSSSSSTNGSISSSTTGSSINGSTTTLAPSISLSTTGEDSSANILFISLAIIAALALLF